MIDFFKRRKDIYDLIEFLVEYRNPDFYITKNNNRIFVQDKKSLKSLLSSSSITLVSKEYGMIRGVLCVWEAFGGNLKRKYLKINAVSPSVAEKLLTVLLWNFDKDFYIKINKKSTYISILRKKGFEFFHDRGKEMLLLRRKTDGSNINRYRNKS